MKGIEVTSVDPRSPSARVGLEEGVTNIKEITTKIVVRESDIT